MSFSNYFYYNQLDEAGKIIYKGMENNIENMKSGNYTIDFGKQFNDLLNSDNGEEKLTVAFQSAWNAFTYDYVDIFYIDVRKITLETQTTTLGSFATHKVNLSCGENLNYYNEGISSIEDVNRKVKYISSIKKEVVSKLQGYTQYEQVKEVHNWLINNLEYDTSYSMNNNHNIYGAFSNKKVVCDGYARTFKYLLDGLGIENVLVSGTGTNSSNETESHAWNYVKLNGHWYAIDVTWDDPVIIGGGTLTEELRYENFLKGSDSFFKNHKEEGRMSENSMQFKFPTIETQNYIR